MGRQLKMHWQPMTLETRDEEDLRMATKYREAMKKQHDQHCHERRFSVGEQVYVVNPRPNGDKWLYGIITSVDGENRYTVHYGTGERQCHADQLKRREIPWEKLEEVVLRKTTRGGEYEEKEPKGFRKNTVPPKSPSTTVLRRSTRTVKPRKPFEA